MPQYYLFLASRSGVVGHSDNNEGQGETAEPNRELVAVCRAKVSLFERDSSCTFCRITLLADLANSALRMIGGVCGLHSKESFATSAG